MSKNIKVLVAGLALVAALTGAYFIAKHYKNAKFEERIAAVKPQEINLAPLVSDTVVRIQVPTSAINLEKKGETWESIPPEPYRLNQDEIKGMTWSLSNMRAERIIDEAPKDLAAYGLDKPVSHTIVTTSDGKKAEFLGGAKTPSGSGYYVMVSGDPKVYQVPIYPGERLYLGKRDIRQRDLPEFKTTADVRQFILQKGKTRIQIEGLGENLGHMMSSPYKTPCVVDEQRFASLMYFFQELRIIDFDEDNPASLAPFGLDKPAGEVFIQSGSASLRLAFGKSNGKQQYAKFGDSPGVFIVQDVSPALEAMPLDLVRLIILIPNIDTVDVFTIQGEGKTIKGAIHRKDGKETFFIGDREVAESGFRDLYAACISLARDAEHPQRPAKPGATEFRIEYSLNTPPGEKKELLLSGYNRDFYALAQNGVSEFLVSRKQVQNIFAAAGKLVYK